VSTLFVQASNDSGKIKRFRLNKALEMMSWVSAWQTGTEWQSGSYYLMFGRKLGPSVISEFPTETGLDNATLEELLSCK